MHTFVFGLVCIGKGNSSAPRSFGWASLYLRARFFLFILFYCVCLCVCLVCQFSNKGGYGWLRCKMGWLACIYCAIRLEYCYD
jgi:hypothetical protein